MKNINLKSMSKKKKRRVFNYRDAVSGRFVTREYAERNKGRTVRERRR